MTLSSDDPARLALATVLELATAGRFGPSELFLRFLTSPAEDALELAPVAGTIAEAASDAIR